MGKTREKILPDYFSSDKTMGVRHDERVCIAVGFAETPSNTADVGIVGRSEKERWFKSQSKRQQDVDATTWQTLCRVKDPEGKKESRVYCIGCRLKRVKHVCLWGVGRAARSAIIREGTSFGVPWKHPDFDISVDYPLPLPRVRTEDAEITSSRAVNRNLDDYILIALKNNQEPEIEDLRTYNLSGDFNENIIINSKNEHIPSFIKVPKCQFSESLSIGEKSGRKKPTVSCRKVAKGQKFNHSVQTSQSSLGSFSTPEVDFLTNFVGRDDAYGVQTPAGYVKVIASLDSLVLHSHVQGSKTVGTYQVNPDSDTVTWVCFDLDNHHGEHPYVGDDLQKIMYLLDRHNIEYLLEASGSPHSFHIWVFLTKTKTVNAYAFAAQVLREAKRLRWPSFRPELEGEPKYESFPKQKTVGKEKFGNLVKLPLGINLKTGVRSTFGDLDSSGPLPPFPGRVVLCEVSGNEYVPGPKSKSKSKKSKAARKSGKSIPVAKQLTPCMVWSLANSPLEGGEGHDMRHAIASEAKFAGFSQLEIIALFEHLPDFKMEKTEKYVANMMKVQNAPYSCQTLKEKCPNLTGNVDCGSCYKQIHPHGRALVVFP